MSSPKKILFYVQHLLGIGHLKRATTLARAFADKGIEVTLVSGGEFVSVVDADGIQFVQLPAVKATDRTFSGLVNSEGADIDDDLKESRKDKLLSFFNDLEPDMVIVELYPFGRRQLRFELIPLLELARAADWKPVIVSSVRDILVEKNRPERDAEMVEKAKLYFDRILVHGDPDLIPFDKTFPRAAEISDMIYYTGYVVDHDHISNITATDGSGEVIVSSGSGAVGELLLRTALIAKDETVLAGLPWRLLAGHSMPEEIFQAIRDNAGEGVIVERARPDFVTLLKNCRLSISQGGYNTVMEVMATGATGIAVPYAGGNETEQTLRARLLEEKGLIRQIPEDQLIPAKLVEMVNERAEETGRSAGEIDVSGAETSARLVGGWLGA